MTATVSSIQPWGHRLLNKEEAQEYCINAFKMMDITRADLRQMFDTVVRPEEGGDYQVAKLIAALPKFIPLFTKPPATAASSSGPTAAAPTDIDDSPRKTEIPCYTTAQAAAYLGKTIGEFKGLNLQPDLKRKKLVDDQDLFLTDTLDRKIPKSGKPVPEVYFREDIIKYLGLTLHQVNRLTEKIPPDYRMVNTGEKYYLQETLDSIPLSERKCKSGLAVSSAANRTAVKESESEKVKTEPCYSERGMLNQLKVCAKVFNKIVKKNKIKPDLHAYNTTKTEGATSKPLYLPTTVASFKETNSKHLGKFQEGHEEYLTDEDYDLLKTAPKKAPSTLFYGQAAYDWLKTDQNTFTNQKRDNKSWKGPKLTANYQIEGEGVNFAFYTKENLLAHKAKLKAWKEANSSSTPILRKSIPKPTTATTATAASSTSRAQTAASSARAQLRGKKVPCYTERSLEPKLNISRSLLGKMVKYGKMKPDVAGYQESDENEKPQNLFLKETVETFERDNAEHLDLFKMGHSKRIVRRDYEVLKTPADKSVVKAYHGKPVYDKLSTTEVIFHNAIHRMSSKRGSSIDADFVVFGTTSNRSYYTDETLGKFKPKLDSYLAKIGVVAQPSSKKGEKRKHNETVPKVNKTATASLSSEVEPKEQECHRESDLDPTSLKKWVEQGMKPDLYVIENGTKQPLYLDKTVQAFTDRSKLKRPLRSEEAETVMQADVLYKLFHIPADYVSVGNFKPRYYYKRQTLDDYRPMIEAHKGRLTEKTSTATTSSSAAEEPDSEAPKIGRLPPLTSFFDPMNTSIPNSPPAAPRHSIAISPLPLTTPSSFVAHPFPPLPANPHFPPPSATEEPLLVDFLADDNEPLAKRQKTGN